MRWYSLLTFVCILTPYTGREYEGLLKQQYDPDSWEHTAMMEAFPYSRLLLNLFL